MYRVTIDKEACDGVFACLVRDGRFEEDDDDGLATLAGDVRREDGHVVAEFEESIGDARAAAEACPPNAITVTELDEGGVSREADGSREGVQGCR